MSKRYGALWLVVALLLAAVSAIALYKGWDILFPRAAVVAELDPECDLRVGACRSSLPSGAEIEFSIEPRTLPVFAPLRLSVVTKGLVAESVAVDFSGVDMNMGYVRPRLESTAPGTFEGTAMLPVCVRDRMTWEAKVLLQTPAGLVAAPFRFETVSQGAFPP